MEAMSFGDEQCLKLNHTIAEGNTYDFIDVQFMSTDDVHLHNLWSIRCDYYANISSNSKVGHTEKIISNRICPCNFLEFENLILMSHHTFTGTAWFFYYRNTIMLFRTTNYSVISRCDRSCRLCF